MPTLVYKGVHHDGDQDFLGFVVYPGAHVGAIPHAPRPPGMLGAGTYPVYRSIQLDTIVFAIRDAEIHVHGNIPSTWITIRHDIH